MGFRKVFCLSDLLETTLTGTRECKKKILNGRLPKEKMLCIWHASSQNIKEDQQRETNLSF